MSRAQVIVDVIQAEFGESTARDPAAFRGKFRKMAANPYAFYRGMACLFYHDLTSHFADESFVDSRTGRVWIHGDLHAANFGTFMDASGRLVFNVNDFDEAYVGPFIWDLKRFSASLALIGYAKALSDQVITDLVTRFAAAYLEELRRPSASLTLDTAAGPLLGVLRRARMCTRVGMLDSRTTIESFDRRFTRGPEVYEVDGDLKQRVLAAYEQYLTTLPPSPVTAGEAARVKDVMVIKGAGIGSAGLPSYNLLLEGNTEALENDVIIYMKQAQTPAVARHVDDPVAASYFHHQGHRTAESQRALQLNADPWVGFTSLDGVGQVVAEISPYEADLAWSDVNDPADLAAIVSDLARAVARMHSAADDSSTHTLVSFSTEQAVLDSVGDQDTAFASCLVDFSHAYALRTREDHALFVDLFRNNGLPGI